MTFGPRGNSETIRTGTWQFGNTSRNSPPSTRSLRTSSWRTSNTRTSLNTIKRWWMLSMTCVVPRGLCMPLSSVWTESFSAYQILLESLLDSTYLLSTTYYLQTQVCFYWGIVLGYRYCGFRQPSRIRGHPGATGDVRQLLWGHRQPISMAPRLRPSQTMMTTWYFICTLIIVHGAQVAAADAVAVLAAVVTGDSHGGDCHDR